MSRVNTMPNGLIPFDTGEFVGVSIHFCIGLFGVVGALIIIISNWNLKSSPSTLLTLSLAWADLYFCISVVIFGGIDLFHGGWATGTVGCVVDSVVILSSCFCSVLTLMAITMERYLVVLYSYVLSWKTSWIWISSLWILSFVIGLIPIIGGSSGSAYGLQSGKMICTVAWYDLSPAAILMEVLSLGTLLSCLGVMIFCYTRIVVAYISSRRSARSAGAKMITTMATNKSTSTNKTKSTTTEDSLASGAKPTDSAQSGTTVKTELEKEKSKETFSVSEKKLLLKSVAITGAFACLWTPYLFKIIIETASQTAVPSGWDMFVSLCALSNSAINPVLLITLDARFQRNALALFGFDSRK